MILVRRIPPLFALPLAALGGLVLTAGTPPLAWWGAGFLGCALITAALWQQKAWFGALGGAVAGAAYWLTEIHWLTLYLGPIPWLALSAVMLAWYAVMGVLIALATRGLGNWVLSAPWRILAQSVTVAALWMTREQVQSVWPYGGFAWGRLAHTQASGPFSALVSWLGFSGLSALIALIAASAVALCFSWRDRRRPSLPAWRPVAGVSILAVLALVGLAFVPIAPVTQTGSLRVAAVQGNSKSGIFDDRENGDVFASYVDGTTQLLDRLETEGDHVDLIVWPENSAEFNLPQQPYRLRSVQRLAARANAPIVVGSVLQDANGNYTNSTLVISAEGDTGLRYDKRRPVPFAEYMPSREFFHALVPDLVDLVQLDYQPGRLPTTLAIPLDPRDTFDPTTVRAGVAICFDIIFDDHARAFANDGAQLILAQTNNADFGRTAESAQQLQIARLRAIESGRALVNISTVGTSAIVLADGRDEARLEPYTQASMVASIPLVDGVTPALRFGGVFTAGVMSLGGLGLGCALVGLVRSRRRALSPAAPEE